MKSRLDEFGGDEPQPVLAGVVHVDAKTTLDVGHPRGAVILRHGDQE
jgi:hypothetical protein